MTQPVDSPKLSLQFFESNQLLSLSRRTFPRSGKRRGLGGSFLQGLVAYLIVKMIASPNMMPAVRVLFSEIRTDIPRNQSMDFNGAAKRYGMNVWNMGASEGM